jgi:hypothetical protein
MSKSSTEIFEWVILLMRLADEKYADEEIKYGHTHHVYALLPDRCFMTVVEGTSE